MIKTFTHEKDLKYSATVDITIMTDGTMLGKISAYHNNVSAELGITKPLKSSASPRLEAMSLTNKLTRLAYDFIAAAVASDEPVGPTGPRPEDING